MKILFLSHYFPPEVNAPSHRTFEHCKEWAAAGHEVHVVTCVPSHPRGLPFPGYRKCWYQKETISKVEVHRVWTLLAPNEGKFRRLLNYLSFVPTAVLRSLRLGRADVIIATSPQFFCAVAGWVASLLKRTPWVFEVRDLWPESARAVGAVGAASVIGLAERLEIKMYGSARAVACRARPFIVNIAARGIGREKLWYVPNGMELAFWEAGSRAQARKSLGLEGRLVVSYVGTVGMAHGLGTLVEAAELLAVRRPEALFVVAGDGADRCHVQKLVEEKGLHNIIFTGLVSRERARDILLASDVSLVLLRKSPLFETVIPSKLLEAFAAGCPAVVGVSGEAKRLVLEAGGGIPVEPENAEAVAAAIDQLATKPDMRTAMGAAAREYVHREFDRRTWATRYVDLIHGICRPAA